MYGIYKCIHPHLVDFHGFHVGWFPTIGTIPQDFFQKKTEEHIPMITLHHDHQQSHIQLAGCHQLTDTYEGMRLWGIWL